MTHNNIFNAFRPILKMFSLRIRKDLKGDLNFEGVFRLFMLGIGAINVLGFLAVLLLIGQDNLAQLEVIISFAIFLFVIPLLADFFPTRRSLVLYTVDHHPLMWGDRFLLWILANEMNVLNYVLFFGALALLMFPFAGWNFKIILLASLLLARQLSFFLRISLSFNVSVKYNWHLYLPVCIGVTPFLAALMFIAFDIRPNYLPAIFLAALSMLVYLQAGILSLGRQKVHAKKQAFVSKKGNWIYGGRLSKRLATSMLFGLVLKVVFVLLSLVQFATKGEYLFGVDFLLFLYVSPVTIFSFALNNFFAFDPHYYYNIYFRTGRIDVFVKSYLQTCIIFVAIDFFVLIIMFTMFDQLPMLFELLPFYAVTCSILVAGGLYFSTSFALKIASKNMLTSFKTYTHPLSGLFGILTVAAVRYLNFDLPLIPAIVVVLSVIFGLFTMKYFSAKANRVINIITKD
jgi:hypothetical protein